MICAIKTKKRPYKKAILGLIDSIGAFDMSTFENLLLDDFKQKSSSKFINIDNYLNVVSEVLTELNIDGFDKIKFKNAFPLTKTNVIPELDFENHPSIVFKNSPLAFRYMEVELKKNIVNFTYLDSVNKQYIVGNDMVNNAIVEYKNRLFNSLLDYLGKEKNFLYTPEGTVDSTVYETTLKEAFDKFGYNSEKFDNNVILSNEIKERYDVFNAMFILNNFDKIIKREFGNAITIDENYLNYLDISAGNKYNFDSTILQTAFFSDDTHEAKDAKLLTSPLIKIITATIPFYDSNNNPVVGEYLGNTRFIDFGSNIPDLEFNLDENIFKETFNENPREFITTLFNKLSPDDIVKYFKGNADTYYSLKNYLQNGGVISEANKKATKIDKGNLTDFIDLQSLFAFELSKAWSPKYIEYAEKTGELSIKDFSSYTNTTGLVLDQINTALTSLVTAGISIQTIPTSSKGRNKYFKQVTGFEIQPLLTLGVTDAEITKFLDLLRERHLKMISNDKASYRDINSEDQSFNDIITKLVTANKFLPSSVFKDSNNNGIPTSRQSSMSANFRHNIKMFSKYMPNAAEYNLFVANPKISGNPYIRLELTTQYSDTGIAADEMMMKEDIYASFNYDFLKAAKKDLFLFQPVAYSDKSTNSLPPIKLNIPVYKDKSFKAMSNEELIEFYYDYESRYFKTLMVDVLTSWYNLLELEIPNIETKEDIDKYSAEINEKLAGLTKYKIYQLIQEQFKKGNKDVEITEEYHFVKYTDKIQLNRELFNLNEVYESIDTFKPYHYNNYLQFQKNITETFLVKDGNKAIVDFGLDYKDLPFNNETEFNNDLKVKFTQHKAATLAEDYNETVFPFYIYSNGERFITKDKTAEEIYKLVENGSVIVNPFFNRYLLMNNFMTSQYLAITSKHPYLYAVKGISTTSDLNLEKSKRLDAMSKRMVQHPATKMRYLKNKLDGIGTSMNVAVVEDYGMKVNTSSGFGTDQDTTDGGAYIMPIMSRLQERSLPASGIKGVQKPICIALGKGRSSMLKFAQNPITNEMIRSSKTSDIPYAEMIRKAYDIKWTEDYDLTENLYGQTFMTSDSLVLTDQSKLIANINGSYYSINIVSSNGNFIHTVKYSKLDKNGNLTGDEFRKDIKIDSIYTLWKALGGENSLSLKDGKLVKSDVSWDAVTAYVNNIKSPTKTVQNGKIFGKITQPLKSQMIDMITFKSGMKNGATNVNPSDVLFNDDELLYFDFDLSNAGVQQNQNHIADDSVVSQPTQVVSALASLGYTFEFAEEIYQEMGKLIDKVASDFKEVVDTEDKEKIYNHLAKIMTKVFKDADRLGNGQNYIEIIAKKLEEDPTLKIPFSNPNLFGLFTSTLISKINRDIFKKKFKGIAATLNLSAGSKQVHNIGGLFMTTEDIYDEITELLQSEELITPADVELKNALLSIINIEGQPVLNDVSNELIQIWLQFKNPNTTVSSNDLELYDRIQAPTTETGEFILTGKVYKSGENIYINSPAKLRELVRLNDPVVKINSKSRDLKPSEITWDESYKPTEEYLVSDYYDKPWKDDPTQSNKARLFSLKTKPEEYFELVEDIDKDTRIPNGEYSVHFKTTGIQALTEKEKVELINIISSQIPIGAKLSTWGELTKGGISGLNRFKKAGFKETNEYRNVKDSDKNDIIIPILQKVSPKRNFWTTDAMILIGANFEKLPEDLNQQLISYLTYIGRPDLIGKKDKSDIIEIKKLVQKWVHRTTSLLKRNLNYRPIEEFRNPDGSYDFNSYFLNDNLYNKFDQEYTINDGFISVSDFKMTNFEVILPKVYRSASKIGDNSLYKIMKQGVNYYKPIVSKIYEEVGVTPFFIRSNKLTLNIDFKNSAYDDSTIKRNHLLKTEVKDDKTITYRVDQSGNILYLMPEGSEIHNVNGREILVLKNKKPEDIEKVFKSVKDAYNIDYTGSNDLNTQESIDMLKLMGSLNSLPFYRKQYYDLYRQFNSEVEKLESKYLSDKNKLKIQDVVSEFGHEEAQKKNLQNYVDRLKEEIIETINSTFKDTKDQRIESIAQMMFSSFVKSQEIVSSRIPAQAFQSFMAMQNVAFTNDESNNMFVSIWQLVLQGSDFDIDKAFNIMYDLDDNGIYRAWSPLFDYTSAETLTLSEELPTPTGEKIKIEFLPELITGDIPIPDNFINLDFYIGVENVNPNLQNSIDVIKIVNANKGKIFYTTNKNYKGLQHIINSHNTFKYSIEAGNNKIFSGIKKIITDLENKVSAESPIDMTDHQLPAQKMDSGLKNLEDGTSKWKVKSDNQIGKVTVGPMANGAKVFFGLTQYFNSKYKKSAGNKIDPLTYFERNFTFGANTYKKTTIADVFLNKNQKQLIRGYIEQQLANIPGIIKQIDETTGNVVYTQPIKIKDVNFDLKFVLDKNNSLVFSENDASLPISSLISAATDNAKELLLAKLNAGMDFAGMHIYLTVMGFSVKDITDFMTHPAINEIAKKLSSNRFTGNAPKKYKVVADVLKAYNFDENTNKDAFIKQFNSISQGADELKNMNIFLGLNKGIDGSFDALHKLMTNMSKIPVIRQLELTGDNDSIVEFKKAVLNDKPYLRDDLEGFNIIVNRLVKNGIIGEKVDMFKFVKDSNYQKDIIDYYNLVKHTINIYDVAMNLPHIKEMLVSFVYTVELVKNGSNKYRFATSVPEILETYASLISKKNLKEENIQYNFGKKNAGIKFDEKMFAKIIPLYDEMVISEWLKSDNLKGLHLKVSDLSKLTKGKVNVFKDVASNDTIPATDTDIIYLDTPKGIANFIYNVEQIIIPHLKRKNPDNKFMNDLIYESGNRYSKKFRPKLNYSSNEQDEIKLLEYDESLKSFNRISNNSIEEGMFTFGNKSLSVGDIMFLYNTIVNKDKFGPARLTKIFDNYVQTEGSLAQDLLFHYSRMEYDETLKPNTVDVLYTLFNKMKDGKKSVTIKNMSTGASEDLTIGNDNYHFSIGSSDVVLENIDKDMRRFLTHFYENTFIIELNCN